MSYSKHTWTNDTGEPLDAANLNEMEDGIYNAHITADAAVTKATFDANTILKADSDDTPVALNVAEQTLVGRITSGSIAALTASQVRTLLDVPTNSEAVLDTLFDAYTILYADTDNTPAALSIAASRLVGRAAEGGIAALTAAEVKTLIAIDHGADLVGLGDDDHTQYLLVAGSRGLSADWDAGSHKITAEQIESDVTTGTAPLVIASTTLVSNLNADQVDSCEAGVATGNVFKIPGSIAQGDIFYVDASGNLVRLAAGTNNYVLTTQGAGANPVWAAGGAGDMLKSTYDSNDDGVIAAAQLDTGLFLCDGSRNLTGSTIFRSVDNGYIGLVGGTALAGTIVLFGKNEASTPGTIYFSVPDAAKSTLRDAGYFEGCNDTPNLALIFGLKTDTIAEKTADTGVTIDGLTLKDYIINRSADDGAVALLGGSALAGMVAVYGKNEATDAGRIMFLVPDAAKTIYKTGGYFEGCNDTPNLALIFGLKTDTIAEKTADTGVTIDGLCLKDAGLALGSDADGDIYYRASGALARLAKGTAYQKLRMNSGAAAPEYADDVTSLTFVIDGGGEAITTGEKGHLEVPFGCTITQVTMLADQSGSIVVDIWKDSYANYPPTDGDSITASTPVTISSAVKSQDSTLTSWTTAITAGDILAFNVDSCSTITRVTISIRVTKN